MTNHIDPPPPTGEPTILACEWPRAPRRTYHQALRMVWNSIAIAGLIALAAALTQLGM